VIAQIEDTDLNARVAHAEAELAAEQARLSLLKRGARPEEIAQARATLRQLRAEQTLASAETKRQLRLFKQALVSAESADKARRNLAVAKSKVTGARAKLKLLRHRYLPEELALAAAKVKAAAASLAEARAKLSYATITAPISGVVARVKTQEGETVSAGLNAPTFVTIIDLSRLEVATYVDEVDIGRVKIGQPATFTVDSYPDVEFSGQVTAIYPRAVIQSNVVNYITTLSIQNAEGRLKPDMTATVGVVLEKREGVLAVPEKALHREDGKQVVYVSSGDGRKAASRPVSVGRRSGGNIEIIKGLKEGDVVFLNNPTAQPKKGKAP